jgi:hypothetical protein
MAEPENIPETLAALALHLREQCYRDSSFHIGPGWERCDDAHALIQSEAGFEVFYIERGQRCGTEFIEKDEAAACRRFFNLLKDGVWTRAHCVVFTPDAAEAEAAQRLLAAEGIETLRNDMPAYCRANDPRHRVFVLGRDVLCVQQMVEQGRMRAVRFE